MGNALLMTQENLEKELRIAFRAGYAAGKINLDDAKSEEDYIKVFGNSASDYSVDVPSDVDIHEAVVMLNERERCVSAVDSVNEMMAPIPNEILAIISAATASGDSKMLSQIIGTIVSKAYDKIKRRIREGGTLK